MRRLVSRLYAARDGFVRRRLGARGERVEWMALDVAASRAEFPLAGSPPFFVDPDALRAEPERYWLEPGAVERMLAAGDRCLAVRLGEQCVYRAHVMVDPARVAEVLGQRGVAAPAWIVSGVLVHPAHRGQRLHATAMRWLASEARRADVRLLVAWVAAWNQSSRRAFARAGFAPLGSAAAPEHLGGEDGAAS